MDNHADPETLRRLPPAGAEHLAGLADEGLLTLEALQCYVSAVIFVRESDVAMDHLFTDLGVNNREFEAMVSVYHWGPQYETPGAVASLLGMSAAGVTALVNRLETGGLMTRERHPDDGRSVRLRLTPAGEAVVDEALRRQIGWLNDVVRPGLSREELLSLAGLMRRAVRQLLPHYEPPDTRPPAPVPTEE